MNPSQAHVAAQSQTQVAVTTLMGWVADAQKALAAEKLDGVARARLGELILNACRYLSEREDTIKRTAAQADRDAARAARDSPGATRRA